MNFNAPLFMMGNDNGQKNIMLRLTVKNHGLRWLMNIMVNNSGQLYMWLMN